MQAILFFRHSIRRCGAARAKAARLLLGLLVAVGGALAAGGPQWKFNLETGKSAPSTINVVNRCPEPHSFRLSASGAQGFIRFPGGTEVQITAKGSSVVPVEFSAAGLDPGLRSAQIEVRCLDCGRCKQDVQRLGVEMTVIAAAAGPEQPLAAARPNDLPAPAAPSREGDSRLGVEASLFDVTLELVWKLAAVEAEKPSTFSSLLEGNPDAAAAKLWQLDEYRMTPPDRSPSFADRIAATAPVTPRFAFATNFAELVQRAKALGLLNRPPIPSAPPVIYLGEKVSLLVSFVPRTARGGGLPFRGAVPAAFMADDARSAMLAQPGNLGDEDYGLEYDAIPRTWSRGVLVSHSLCGVGPMIWAVTKLTYRGGATETKQTSWDTIAKVPCAQQQGTRVTVQQSTRPSPGPPVIVASGYLVKANRAPTILVARSVLVPR